MNGDRVWVPVPDLGYTVGKIVAGGNLPPTKIKVKREDNGTEVTALKKDIIAFSQSSLNTITDDLITLDDLSEPVILHNVQKRFAKDVIYTYIGSMIVSVNPFRSISHYGEFLIPDYLNKPLSGLEPHLYSVACRAFRDMCDLGQSQAVIISGESGAGKTEATKIILKFLTVAAGDAGADISRAILATNPILEAFGNAKTVRNNNSSRFGKLVMVNFTSGGEITGASIRNYLLEKTRIVYQAPSERNYHIFYQLIKGASSGQRHRWNLLPEISDVCTIT